MHHIVLPIIIFCCLIFFQSLLLFTKKNSSEFYFRLLFLFINVQTRLVDFVEIFLLVVNVLKQSCTCFDNKFKFRS